MKSLVILAALALATPAVASNTGFKLRYPLWWSTTTTSANWISPPYHVKAANSLDLCRMVKGGPGSDRVATFHIYLSDLDRAQSQSCANTFKAFDLKPGEAITFKPYKAGISLAFDVW